MKSRVEVIRLDKNHIEDVANIYHLCYPRQSKDVITAKTWVLSNVSAFPRVQYFVAQPFDYTKVRGYINWRFEGGFARESNGKKESILQLEEIGVDPTYRGRGVATKLVIESLNQMIDFVRNESSDLKLVLVTTNSKNEAAKKLYENTLGTKVQSIVPDLYRGDELMMVARKEELKEKGFQLY